MLLNRVLALFVALGIFTTALGFAQTPGSETSRRRAPRSETHQPVSAVAKLYAVARLMDSHDNWLRASELLRELLEMRLSNDFVVSRLRTVKQYVDREVGRRARAELTEGRLDTHSFLEARLLVVECLQELRPRLNLSWTGEVRHVRKLIFSAVFPHAEEYGRIEFPAPRTYSFDTYGYTRANIQALMYARGGAPVSPMFSQYIRERRESRPSDVSSWSDEFGSSNQLTELGYFRDRIGGALMSEGVDPNAVLPDDDTWGDATGPSGSSGASGASGGRPGSRSPRGSAPRTGGGWGDSWDDFPDDWGNGGGNGSGGRQTTTLRRAWEIVWEAISTLRNHRSVDEYEPLTLLMIGISNPDLIEEDPQLRDFMSGVQFKYEVAREGTNGESFQPHDYELVQLINDSLAPSRPGMTLRMEVDGNSAQRVLYLVSNFNGESSIGFNILNFRRMVTYIQTVKHMPPGVFSFVAATPQNISRLVETLNTALRRLSTSENFIYRVLSHPAGLLFDLVFTVGGNSITRVAETTSRLVTRVMANPRMVSVVNTLKSERFLRTMVALSVASDLIAGGIELANASDESRRAEIALHTGANVASSLVYLLRYRPAVLTAAALDIGHMVFDSIPSTSQVIEYAASYIYRRAYTVVVGRSPRQQQMLELKRQLGIRDYDEAREILASFQRSIESATDLASMETVRHQISEQVGLYAARRLVFHYAEITALNGHGEHDVGEELRTQFEEYSNMHRTWFEAPAGTRPEQYGLAMLDRMFWRKWQQFGGALPELPVRTRRTPSDGTRGDDSSGGGSDRARPTGGSRDGGRGPADDSDFPDHPPARREPSPRVPSEDPDASGVRTDASAD